MAPSPVGPGVGQSPRPGGAEQLCALCLWLAFPQDGLTMCPLYSCLHGGQLKVFSGTPLAVTKMGEFERNWGWAPIIESLEITQRLHCRLAEWWDFWWHENECGSCRSPPGPAGDHMGHGEPKVAQWYQYNWEGVGSTLSQITSESAFWEN